MTATVCQAAKFLHVPLSSADGSYRVSGHSLRATGAQGLAKLGLDVWAIQLLGRWGSAAVLGYVREACLESSAEWATRAAISSDLVSVVAQRTTLPSACSGSFCGFLGWGIYGVGARLTYDSGDPNHAGRLPRHRVLGQAQGFVHPRGCGECERRSACSINRSPSASLSNSMTVCGWKFCASNVQLVPRVDLPPSYKQLCEKCYPEPRSTRKAELAPAARRLRIPS